MLGQAMDNSEKFLNRVKGSAENLAAHLQQKSNVPIEQYVDLASVEALSDALSLDPNLVTRDDLVRIHVIRDAVHDALQKATDEQDEHEHSIEQLLNALSRLYVDVERLVKLNDQTVAEAKALVTELSMSQREMVAPSVAQEVSTQATSIITNVHINQRNIHLNVLNFDVGELNLVKEFKMNIKRLSASVFAIKLAFDKGIVFEGTIRFLNEGADRILSDISNFAEFIAKKYETAKEFVTAITPLVEKGTRFVRFIGSVIKDLFDGGVEQQKEVDLTVQTKFKATSALLSSAQAPNGDIVFGGVRGQNFTFVKRTGQFLRMPIATQNEIHSLAVLPDGLGLALGTSEGLFWARSAEGNRNTTKSTVNERVSVVRMIDWGGHYNAVVSGTKNGHLRRWSLAGGLTPHRDSITNMAITQKIGRSIQAITQWEDKIVVATEDRVCVLDERLETVFEVPVGIHIAAMCAFPGDSVVVVGTGLLAEINLAKGAYNRMLTVTPTTEYVAIGHLNDRIAVAATSGGRVRALDINSGAEIGEVSVDMQIRGLEVSDNSVFIYGGTWRAQESPVVKILWAERLAG